MNDKKFNAILSKNDIARDIADLVRDKIISLTTASYTINRLNDIENFLGKGNQPGITSIFMNNKQEKRRFVI